MSIIASAPVPAASRLIDADTVPGLTAISRPGMFPVNPPHVAGRAAVPPVKPSADILELGRRVDRLVVGAGLTDDEVAARLGVSADEAFDALETFDAYLRAGRPADAACPPYCSNDHRGEVTEVDGFTLGLVHERILAELTGQDPGWCKPHPTTATVLVESTTERGEVTTPTRVILTVAQGDEGSYSGEDTEAWTGTVEQAEALAAALQAAARIARAAR